MIKNAEAVYVDLASEPHRLNIDINGIEAEDLLIHVDIIAAINYYGMTELLDAIGEEHLKSHLACLENVENRSDRVL